MRPFDNMGQHEYRTSPIKINIESWSRDTRKTAVQSLAACLDLSWSRHGAPNWSPNGAGPALEPLRVAIAGPWTRDDPDAAADRALRGRRSGSERGRRVAAREAWKERKRRDPGQVPPLSGPGGGASAGTRREGSKGGDGRLSGSCVSFSAHRSAATRGCLRGVQGSCPACGDAVECPVGSRPAERALLARPVDPRSARSGTEAMRGRERPSDVRCLCRPLGSGRLRDLAL
jgi:hypothetical protein